MVENMLQPSRAQTWLCVRHALFLIAHDEDSGFRRRLHPVTLNFALSAALLCDLVLSESCVVRGSELVLPVRPPASADPVTAHYYAAAVARMRRGPGAQTEPTDSRGTPQGLGLRAVLFLFAADVTARTQEQLTTAGILSKHRDWFGRTRYSLTRPDLADSARLPARDAVTGQYSAIGVTLCTLVRSLGLHDALLLLDRSQLEPVLAHIERLMREGTSEPLAMIPVINDTLRGVIKERVVGVMG